MNLTLIAAFDRHRVMGRDGTLPWRLPDDLQRFRTLTLDHAVIFGRRTFESIGRPLPRRRLVVLSRQPDFAPPGVEVVPSLEAALLLLAADAEVFVGGGEAVFAAALPLCQTLCLSRVEADVEGDVYFPIVVPALDSGAWLLAEEVHRPADERNQFAHTFERWERAT